MSAAIAVVTALVYFFGFGVAWGIVKYHFKRVVDDESAFLLAVAWPLVLIGVVAAVPVCLGIVVARAGVWIYTRLRISKPRAVKGS